MHTTIQSHIENLFDALIKTDYLQTDPDWLKQTLFKVPRHRFIEQYYDDETPDGIVQVESPTPTSKQLEQIYSNRGMMIREDPHSAASQPSLIFGMLDDLKLARGLKVLEIGTGSGWNAGLIACGVGNDSLVYSIDLQADLVEKARKHLNAVGLNRVNLRVGDGGLGWDGETFDRIIVTVGSPDIPPAWVESLAEGGILVMPLKTRSLADPILRLQKQDGKLTGQFTQWAGFMNLQGDFNSSAEDTLQPPLDPVVEALLQEEPTSVPLPAPCGSDCGFWLRLNGVPIQTLGEHNHQRVNAPIVLDKGAPALYFLQPGAPFKAEKHIDVYGEEQNQQLVDRLIKGVREWANLGRPRFQDYHIELIDPVKADDVVPHSYIDKRPNATLRFSLENAPIQRD